jgi:hypothetical protein
MKMFSSLLEYDLAFGKMTLVKLIQIITDDDEDSGWPIESWLKLIAVVIGMLGELVTGFEPSGTFVMHNGQVSELPATHLIMGRTLRQCFATFSRFHNFFWVRCISTYLLEIWQHRNPLVIQ